jgi:hypothetical protein
MAFNSSSSASDGATAWVLDHHDQEQDRELEPTPLHTARMSQSRHSYRSERWSILSLWNALSDSALDLSIYSAEASEITSTSMEIKAPQPPRVVFDYCHSLKTLCLLGLLFAFLFSFTLIALGATLVHNSRPHPPAWLQGTIVQVGFNTKSYYDPTTIYTPGHFAIPASKTVQTLVPLILNYALTTILEILFIIHSTTQRWSLWKEHRLHFHSNPTLISASKMYLPNRWYINVMFTMALSFSYGTLTTLTNEILVWGYSDGDVGVSDTPYAGPRHGIDFGGWPMLVLGLCLTTQTIICACCLFYDPGMVKSWSTNAITTTRASIHHQHEREHTEPSGSTNKIPSQVSFPVRFLHSAKDRLNADSAPLNTISSNQLDHGMKKLQYSAREMIPAARRITTLLWIFTASLVAATTIVAIVATRRGLTTPAYVAELAATLDISSFWEWYGSMWIRYADAESYILSHAENYDGATIVLQSSIQVPITLVLHYVGLLFDVIGDEMIWRRASSEKGVKVDPGIVTSTLQKWPGLILFLFKGLAQWIYGSVFHMDSILVVAMIPMVTLTLLFLLLSTFAEVLSRWRPKGEQPVTFGSLALLETYMDDLEGDTVFWKGEMKSIASPQSAQV